ncbi:hypothetical protein C1I98_02880 [Spongiactinospora gelatinilytica]|uniref:Uncharacterized protein n=1 Tax=Spongiactinospora gelatinilytica TaxID=2666298 RepID=A0A2W2HYC5_9ACTN|nr:hypothetical protein [Spongiactinospora gelatinilytica]PZG55650.1 hypothetical protein C1I98_02880 [Spongiactinospora gelatinilytica]
MLITWRAEQRRRRLASASPFEDRGFVFADEEGKPLSPDSLSRGFKVMAREAGLPAIRLAE